MEFYLESLFKIKKQSELKDSLCFFILLNFIKVLLSNGKDLHFYYTEY